MKSRDALETIRKIVGNDLYEVIARELSGMTVYFPSNHEWQDKTSRNDALREDFYSGEYEISDLAIKYNLSISRVYKIIQHRE